MIQISARCGIVLLIGMAACSLWPNGLTYQQGENRVRDLVDASLATGMDGRPFPPKRDVNARGCGDSNQPESYPHYKYLFPLELLGPDPDSFVDRVAEYWETQDLYLDPDYSADIRRVFATSRDGINLEVFVNYNTGMALIQSSGPCAPSPTESP